MLKSERKFEVRTTRHTYSWEEDLKGSAKKWKDAIDGVVQSLGKKKRSNNGTECASSGARSELFGRRGVAEEETKGSDDYSDLC